MKQYVIVRKSCIDDDWQVGRECLAKTVYDPEELIDIGVLDSDGNKVMARRRVDPIGFIRWADE